MRSMLANGLSDLAFALSSNPLSPRGHLTGSVLSPLTGMPVKPWLESTAALVNNSADMLYLNGLFAFQSNELDLAVNQWSKSLSINHHFLKPIHDLAQQKLPAIRVATDLIPASRPDYYIRMIQSTQRETSEPDAAVYDRVLAESIIRHLKTNSLVEPGRRHATIAGIQQLLGDVDDAVLSWEDALRLHTRDPSYRLEYAQSLVRVGRNDEALQQAMLGQSLNPVDRRFEHLTVRIRQEIRRGGRR
jgi:tetratricopeptide (TPR) repeat protein